MKFRELLRELDKVGGTTSKDLARRLGKSVKEISNDLARLKQMKFAKADYDKRVCKLRGPWGDVCNRGYQYIYCISAQGKSYLNWMDKTKPIEDSEHSELMDRIAACLTLDVKKAIFAYYLSKGIHRYKGPSRRSTFLNETAIIISVLNGAPSPLELENRRLIEENEELACVRTKSERTLTESSGDYESKIKRMERKQVAREEEIKAELERARALFRHAYIQLLKVYFGSRDFLLVKIRKYAPKEEYSAIQEQINDLDRAWRKSIMEDVVSSALGN